MGFGVATKDVENFNRTIKELKFVIGKQHHSSSAYFNRTIKELKSEKKITVELAKQYFNRTIKELK